MIITEDAYMGRGIAKVVYRHPYDQDICIKFPRKKKKRALIDILREISYLEKHQKNLPWLSPYLGSVECNLGVGYMYQIVRNEDGSLSHSITSSDCENNAEALREKVASMYFQLVSHHAVVNDLSLSNVFFRKKANGDFDLILIDGFGNNNFIKIADYSRYFLLKKLNKKFGGLCRRLDIPSDFLIEK